MKLHLIGSAECEVKANTPWGRDFAASLCGKLVHAYTTDRIRFRRSREYCGGCMRSAIASWGWKRSVKNNC